MKRETIAVDMDDVVVDTAQNIIDHVNLNHGAQMTLDRFYSRDPADWNAPDVETAVGWVNAYLETEDFFVNAPMQESIMALRGLKRVHSLYILTGRPDF